MSFNIADRSDQAALMYEKNKNMTIADYQRLEREKNERRNNSSSAKKDPVTSGTSGNKSSGSTGRTSSGRTSSGSSSGKKTAGSSGHSYASDRWNYSDSTPVVDVYGNHMTFGELKRRRQEGYYDTWEEKHHPMTKSELAAKKREEVRAEKEREAAARREAEYDRIVREAYAEYRRNRSSYPELSSDFSAGSADDLFGQNDLVFRRTVEAANADRLDTISRLDRQIDSLLESQEDRWGRAARGLSKKEKQLEEQMKGGIALEKDAPARMLQQWYDLGDADQFAALVRRALHNGTLTRQQYDSWEKALRRDI